MQTAYGFGIALPLPYEQAATRVRDALKAEGFGVISEIDMRQALREKIGVEIPPYTILGACNPRLASQALAQEPEIGLLLPCNVVVRAEGAASHVDIADPKAMLGIVGNPALDAIAAEAEQRLRRVVATLASPTSEKES